MGSNSIFLTIEEAIDATIIDFRQCGRCCRSLAYQNEIGAEDVEIPGA